MRPNRSIPNCTVIPELPYPDIPQAIDWLRAAFAFTLRLQIADHRAQLNVGDGALVLINAPANSPHSTLIRVEDLDPTDLGRHGGPTLAAILRSSGLNEYERS